MERCNDGVEDQGAEEALWGVQTSNNQSSQFWKEPSHERAALPFSAFSHVRKVG
jgi:hypothetical protein